MAIPLLIIHRNQELELPYTTEPRITVSLQRTFILRPCKWLDLLRQAYSGPIKTLNDGCDTAKQSSWMGKQ
jgi:hypothetical protein